MKSARTVAEEIATALFVNGSGHKADRLVMDLTPYTPESAIKGEHQIKSGGGWCFEGAVNQIEQVLIQNLFFSLS